LLQCLEQLINDIANLIAYPCPAKYKTQAKLILRMHLDISRPGATLGGQTYRAGPLKACRAAGAA